MNLNEFPMQNERKKAQGWRNNAAILQMNPNINFSKRTKSKNSTTPSTPSLKWKANQNSVINSVLQTGSSSRTYTSSTSNDSRVILALSEGRGEAACEVGIASIDLSQPKLILCQISDTQSYINTMTKINILNPKEIVIPITFVGIHKTNRLVEKVKQHFRDAKIIPIVRTAFNKTNGMTVVKSLCIPNMNSVLLILQNRYYALAAASGLLTYIENVLNVIYTTHSLKIQYQESEGSTIIDITTADKLELVACAKQPLHKQYSSLYSIMNFCLTKIGARTLRASILQPPSTKAEIESRLECVSELIERSGTGATFVLRSLLTKIQNVDQLLNVVTLIPKQPQECSERQLNYLLLLNSFFEILEPLRECLCEFRNPFFKEVSDNIARPEFDYIKSLIRTVMVEDARPAKGANGALQRCFAIKPGINSLLDLVRKSYSERLDEMRNYVKNLGEKYNLPLTLNNTNTKGYHMVLPLKKNEKRSFKRSMLPNEFIQVDRLSGSITMKTTDLINLSVRIEEIMMNILKISNVIIHKTLANIKEHVAHFYKLCEDISKLDMLQSLAKLSGDTNYVRPIFEDYMEIKEGRHPILDFICSETPTSNSITATDDHNVHIISGPNGSGKSIFIRQLVLIQVMAQVGCYVPAESATFRIADRILARISLDDNPDIGVSAFVLEILEVEYFLEAMSKNTLIVVDELCRSTSVEEGTALAMAICEKLAETPAFVFFTTHFKAMGILGNIYMNIKVWQMETIMEEANSRIHFNFIYRLLEGMTTLEHYGVYMAKNCWPNEPVNYALDVLKNIKSQQIDFPQSYKQNYFYHHLKYDLEADFRLLKKKRKLFPNVLNEKLKKYEDSLKKRDESITLQNQSIRTLKFVEKSNSIECDSTEPKRGMEQLEQKTSSSSGYVIQNTSFGNSTPQNEEEEENHISQSEKVPEYDQTFSRSQRESINDSSNYGDITFTGRSISSNSQRDNEDDVDIRNVTFNWNPNQNETGNNCYDYLGLYQNDSFKNDNLKSYFVANNLGLGSLHPDPSVVGSSSSIHRSDVMDCDRTIIKTYSGHQEFTEFNNSKRHFKIPAPIKCSSEVQSINDTSFLSVNEAQFSLPLAENTNRTSTPLQKNKTLNNNNEKFSFTEHKLCQGGVNRKNDTVSQCSEKEFIESELESFSEYFSDFNWEEENNRNLEVTSNKCSITINSNDTHKLNPQEMESVISDLESVSEYFSDNEWKSEEPETIKNISEEYQVSISYSPDESILKEFADNKQSSGESLFKIEAKRKKIKVPFHTPKPFVKKTKRRLRTNKEHKKVNDYINLTDGKPSEVNQEQNVNSLQEVQALEKSHSPQKDLEEKGSNKKIIILQNIVLNPTTDYHQSEIQKPVIESKEGQINFINGDFNEQKKDQTNILVDELVTRNVEIETASLKDECTTQSTKVRGKDLIMIEKSKSISSEDFFKIETNTTKKRKLGIRHKRPKKSTKELNTDHSDNSNQDTTTKIRDKNTEEIYYSANESFQDIQKNPTLLIQNSSSDTKTFENGKTPLSTFKILKRKKFISPLKLTRKEIIEEFEKQDRLMLENNCPEQYIQNILNRPSIKSIQNCECIAMICKTPQGTKVVTPPPTKKLKKSRPKRFLPPLRDKQIQPFDVSLFSDKNVEKFDKMMGYDKHNFSFNGSSFKLNVKKSRETKETALEWNFTQQHTINDKKNSSFTLNKINKTAAGDENDNKKRFFELSKYFEEKEESLSEFDTFLSFDEDSKETHNTEKKRADDAESDIDSIMKKYLN